KSPQIEFTDNQSTQTFGNTTAQLLLLPVNSSSSFITPTYTPLPKLSTPEHINNPRKGDLTKNREEIEEGEVLAKILEDSRDPRILYKKKFESYDLTLGTWKHIGNEILRGNTDQVAKEYCEPKNKARYKLYKYLNTPD